MAYIELHMWIITKNVTLKFLIELEQSLTKITNFITNTILKFTIKI
jgi:hypothetical protein